MTKIELFLELCSRGTIKEASVYYSFSHCYVEKSNPCFSCDLAKECNILMSGFLPTVNKYDTETIKIISEKYPELFL